MANFKNSNDRVAELLISIEHEFNIENLDMAIDFLFKLQSLTFDKLSELQNEVLSSVIAWAEESKYMKMHSYCNIAKKLFVALKGELFKMDFRTAWEMLFEA